MKINKLNYEAFAIDYLEGNLSIEDQHAMETFLLAHPQIKEEIVSMGAFELPEFQTMSYPVKKELYKSRKHYYMPILAFAASLLFLLTIGYQWMTDGPDQTINNNVESELVENPVKDSPHETEIKPIEIINATPTNPTKERDVSGTNSNNIITKSAQVLIENTFDPSGEPKHEVAKFSENLSDRVIEEEIKAAAEKAKTMPVKNTQITLNSPRKIIKAVALESMDHQPESKSLEVKSIDFILYDLSESISITRIAAVKKNRNFSRLIQPESFEGKQLSNIKKAIVPEAFSNLFSRKSTKTD